VDGGVSDPAAGPRAVADKDEEEAVAGGRPSPHVPAVGERRDLLAVDVEDRLEAVGADGAVDGEVEVVAGRTGDRVRLRRNGQRTAAPRLLRPRAAAEFEAVLRCPAARSDRGRTQ
jgi:hypothetical protein